MSTVAKIDNAPSDTEIELARKSRQKLSAFVGHNLKISLGSTKIELPASAVQLLLNILTEMSEGNAVTLMPVNGRLTTQQAADLLGVSRPFITRQLIEGKLKFQKVGTHRRIGFADLADFRRKMMEESNVAMDELVAGAQELKMGY